MSRLAAGVRRASPNLQGVRCALRGRGTGWYCKPHDKITIAGHIQCTKPSAKRPESTDVNRHLSLEGDIDDRIGRRAKTKAYRA